MAEILDNEVITAEILNEISTDLGYSELKFTDNEKFGNDKLNLITGDLVSSGILNILNKCECTVSDGKIKVDTGVIVFSDGAKKRITEANEFEILTGGINYIYAKNDTSTGKIYLVNSLEEPTDDFVLLAIYSDGSITDRRAFAKAKVELPTEGNSYCKKISTTSVPTTKTIMVNLSVANASKIFIRTYYGGDYKLVCFNTETWSVGEYFRIGNTSGSINYVTTRYVSNENDVITFEIDFDRAHFYDGYVYESEFYVYGGL